MTQRAHLQRFRKKFAKLLPAAARIFGAELGLSSYGEHQAVVDLLARHCDNVLSPLNITLIDFLVLYRDSNALARIPSPTVLNNIYDDVIDAVNGPRPGEDPSHLQQAGNLHTASDAQAFQLANSPDQDQEQEAAAAACDAAAADAAVAAVAAAAAAAAAAGPANAAVNAAAASYAERSAMAPDVSRVLPPPPPANSTPRSAVRNPYARNEIPPSSLPTSLPLPVQLTERITVMGASSAQSQNVNET
eukprot:990785_1